MMMNKYFPLAAIIILSVIGCDAKQRKVHHAPPSKIATTSVEVIGGLKRWKQIGLIRATAVVTIYDETGRGIINEQHQVIDIHRNIIRASAALPHGQWSATVTADGEASVKTTYLTFIISILAGFIYVCIYQIKTSTLKTVSDLPLSVNASSDKINQIIIALEKGMVL